ncbi:MAG: SDR family NAD-dependent epimerase/dehydratase, partial [Planctomycetota bacterium]
SILEIAETIIRLSGSKSEIITKPLPLDDPERRKPDITLAQEILNWQPTISLEDGLELTIEYFRPIAPKNSPPSQSPR